MKKLILILTTLLFFPCAVSSYENSFEYPDKILDLINGTSTIKTVINYRTWEKEKIINEIKQKNTAAIAINMGGGYFIALTHATEHENFIVHDTPFGSFNEFINIISYEFSIDGHETELMGREGDISLFRAINYTKLTSCKIGDSDLLKLGDTVIVIGNSFMLGINVKKGIVSKLDHSRDHVFMITNPTNPGDSGSMLVAKQDDEYYIVGIAQATFGEGMGYALRINYVKGVLNRLLSKSMEAIIFIDQPEKKIIVESWSENP